MTQRNLITIFALQRMHTSTHHHHHHHHHIIIIVIVIIIIIILSEGNSHILFALTLSPQYPKNTK